MGKGCGGLWGGDLGPVDASSEFREPSKEMHSYTVLYLTKEQCGTVDLFFTFNWEANAADIQ